MSDFEDPRQLFKCAQSDCDDDRAGGTPLCARHLRAQEVAAGATSISEPELEAKVAMVRTEDDDHPGEKKVYDPKTGEPSWVADPNYVVKSGADGIHRAFASVGMPPPEKLYVGPDPDVNGAPAPLRNDPWDRPQRPDPAELEPHWDGSQWVLRPKERTVDLVRVRALVEALVTELGLDV